MPDITKVEQIKDGSKVNNFDLGTHELKRGTFCDRHQFRASWHDYNNGIYFVSICSSEKKHTFGRITDNTFCSSDLGKIITEHLNNLSTYYPDVELWNSVVMPNHIHMIIAVGTRFIASAKTNDSNAKAANNLGCLKQPKYDDKCEDFHHNSRLATIIGSFLRPV